MNNDYNVLSDKAYQERMFEFDLQLFGGGGGGKSGVKIIGTIAAAAFGFFNPTMFGLTATAHFGGAVMGAALFSSVWGAFSKPKVNDFGSTSVSNIQRFDRAQESMSYDGQIPVVYGLRKLTGNQTYHKADSDASTLYKHVVLCEGGIEGIESACANDLIIPTGSQTSNTVFTLQNVKYEDATVYKKGHTLTLYANGKTRNLYLCTTDDMTTGNTYWEYQVNMSSLISWLNRLGEGWQAFPTASTSMYPGNLWDITEKTATETVWLSYDDLRWEYGLNFGILVPETFVHDGFHYQYTREFEGHGTNILYKYNRFQYKSISAYRTPVNFQASTVSGGTSYTFHDGDTPETYETTGGYPKMAWLDMKFTTASEIGGGNPSVDCIVKGKKIYDIRTGKTEYSTNPAMCVRDFILSTRYGLGKWFTEDDLDIDSWTEAADYCDEIITFLNGDGAEINAKRYELNMIIDSRRSALEWLQEMLANFAGYIVYSQGKIKLKIEKEEPISYEFNDNNCKDLKIEPLKLSETPNRYEISFIDPENNWGSVKALVEDFADQKQRQKIVSKSVSLEGVTSQNQALRLGRFYRDYNLTCPIQVSFSTGIQAMHLEPGDVVSLSYHGVFKGMPIRIAEIKETNKGTFEINGRQYNDTIYGDILGGGVHWYNYATMASPYAGDVLDPFNITLKEGGILGKDGTYVGYVDVKWDKPAYAFIDYYEVYYKYDFTSWTYVGSPHDTACTIMNTMAGQTIYVLVKTVNTIGRQSNGNMESLYLQGKLLPPTNVTNFTVVELANEKLQATITEVNDVDLAYYELRQGSSWNRSRLIGTFTGSSYTWPAVDAGTLTFWVKAVDTSGIYSEKPAKAICTVMNLTPRNVIYERTVPEEEWITHSMVKCLNGYWRIRAKKVLGDYDYFSEIFGGLPLLMTDAYILLPTIDLGENIIDTTAFWKDLDGVYHLRSKEKLGDFERFSDIFQHSYSYEKAKYQKSTFLNLKVDSYTDGDARYTVEYRTSIDNEHWSEWLPENEKQFAGRYVQVRILAETLDGTGNIYIRRITTSIDVPDIEEIIENVRIHETTTIKYNGRVFTEIKSIACYTQIDGVQATCWIERQGNSSSDISILNDNGERADGLLQKMIVRGY